MGQDWCIVNVDKEEGQYTGRLGEYMWNFGDFVYGQNPETLLRLLAKPVKLPSGSYEPPRTKGIKKLATKEGEHLHCLQALPNDVLFCLFDELDYVSLTLLMMTSEQFLQLGYGPLQRKIRACCGTWAGSRLICVGEYCETEHLPEGLLSPKQVQALKEGLLKDEWDGWDDCHPNEEYVPKPVTLFSMAEHRFRDPRVKHRNHDEIFHHLYSPGPTLPYALSSYFHNLWQHPFREFFPDADTWILRNLTAKQYVNGDVLYSAFVPILQPSYMCAPSSSSESSFEPMSPFLSHKISRLFTSYHV